MPEDMPRTIGVAVAEVVMHLRQRQSQTPKRPAVSLKVKFKPVSGEKEDWYIQLVRRFLWAGVTIALL